MDYEQYIAKLPVSGVAVEYDEAKSHNSHTFIRNEVYDFPKRAYVRIRTEQRIYESDFDLEILRYVDLTFDTKSHDKVNRFYLLNEPPLNVMSNAFRFTKFASTFGEDNRLIIGNIIQAHMDLTPALYAVINDQNVMKHLRINIPLNQNLLAMIHKILAYNAQIESVTFDCIYDKDITSDDIYHFVEKTNLRKIKFKHSPLLDIERVCDIIRDNTHLQVLRVNVVRQDINYDIIADLLKHNTTLVVFYGNYEYISKSVYGRLHDRPLCNFDYCKNNRAALCHRASLKS